jgi:hypothetical protein
MGVTLYIVAAAAILAMQQFIPRPVAKALCWASLLLVPVGLWMLMTQSAGG